MGPRGCLCTGVLVSDYGKPFDVDMTGTLYAWKHVTDSMRASTCVNAWHRWGCACCTNDESVGSYNDDEEG